MVIFVSFDFDRTLGDFSIAHGNAILNAIHQTFDNRFIVNWFDLNLSGQTDMEIVTNLVHNHGLSYETIFSKMSECLGTIKEDFLQYVQEYPIELLDKVPETLEWLKHKEVKMGLTTGNIKSVAWAKTENAGIRKYFSLGSFGDEGFDRTYILNLTKKRAVEMFNLSSKDVFIHVGDSIKDVKSAIETGFIPIGIATGHYNNEQLYDAGAPYVLNKFSDLKPIINKLTQKQSISVIL